MPTATPVTAPVGNGTAAPVLLNENANAVVGDLAHFGTIGGAPGNAPIDGMTCAQMNAKTHYHVHLSIYQNGHQLAIPAGTGIFDGQVAIPLYFVDTVNASGCTYPTHVHALMGVVHIEDPTGYDLTHTLGQFLDVWGESLTTGGFADLAGPTRWFDTDETTGTPGHHPVTELTGVDPHGITMQRHHEYTIEVGPAYVGTPNYTWGGGL